MSTRAELLRDLMKICREASDMNDDTEGTYLDNCCIDALFNYVSLNALKLITIKVKCEIEKDKKNRELEELEELDELVKEDIE